MKDEPVRPAPAGVPPAPRAAPDHDPAGLDVALREAAGVGAFQMRAAVLRGDAWVPARTTTLGRAGIRLVMPGTPPDPGTVWVALQTRHLGPGVLFLEGEVLVGRGSGQGSWLTTRHRAAECEGDVHALEAYLRGLLHVVSPDPEAYEAAGERTRYRFGPDVLADTSPVAGPPGGGLAHEPGAPWPEPRGDGAEARRPRAGNRPSRQDTLRGVAVRVPTGPSARSVALGIDAWMEGPAAGGTVTLLRALADGTSLTLEARDRAPDEGDPVRLLLHAPTPHGARVVRLEGTVAPDPPDRRPSSRVRDVRLDPDANDAAAWRELLEARRGR